MMSKHRQNTIEIRNLPPEANEQTIRNAWIKIDLPKVSVEMSKLEQASPTKLNRSSDDEDEVRCDDAKSAGDGEKKFKKLTRPELARTPRRNKRHLKKHMSYQLSFKSEVDMLSVIKVLQDRHLEAVMSGSELSDFDMFDSTSRDKSVMTPRRSCPEPLSLTQ